MNTDHIVVGGESPIFGTIFSVADQKFGRSESGRQFYSATMVSGPDIDRELSIGLDMLLDGWEIRESPEFPVTLFDGDVRLRSTGSGTLRLSGEWLRSLGVRDAPSEKIPGSAIVEAVAFEHDPIDMRFNGFIGKLWIDEVDIADGCQVFLRIRPDIEQAWFGEKSELDTLEFAKWIGRLA